MVYLLLYKIVSNQRFKNSLDPSNALDKYIENKRILNKFRVIEGIHCRLMKILKKLFLPYAT